LPHLRSRQRQACTSQSLLCPACASFDLVDLQKRHLIGGMPMTVLFLPERLRALGFGIAGGTGAYSLFVAVVCLHACRVREPLASAEPSPQYEQDPAPLVVLGF